MEKIGIFKYCRGCLMDCCDCPYFEEDCKYGTDYVICSKKLKEVKQDKKEVKIDLQEKYDIERS